MELTTEHLDLLRVVDEMETPNAAPGTRAAGQRLLELCQECGGAHSWHPSAPRHGTNPRESELRDQELLEVHVGMASVHQWDQPAETADQYGLR